MIQSLKLSLRKPGWSYLDRTFSDSLLFDKNINFCAGEVVKSMRTLNARIDHIAHAHDNNNKKKDGLSSHVIRTLASDDVYEVSLVQQCRSLEQQIATGTWLSEAMSWESHWCMLSSAWCKWARMWIRWTGTMEWNGGVEYWTGLLKCHAHLLCNYRMYSCWEEWSHPMQAEAVTIKEQCWASYDCFNTAMSSILVKA